MAEATAQQFFGTLLAILIVALFLYGIILLIQWLAKGNQRTVSREADPIAPVTYVPVQTQSFNPGMRMATGTGTTSMGGMSMGAGGTTVGAGMKVGGGGKSGAL